MSGTVTVRLRGARVRLTARHLLGEGGEARVFLHKDEALKVFHDAPAGLSSLDRRALARLARLRTEKLQTFPAGLPAEVVGPRELLWHEVQDEVVGYAMPRVDGAHDLARLAQRKWREGVVDNGGVVETFRHLHTVVTGVHRAGVVVGDLNDGNVLFRDRQVFLIDADSMQFGGLPCVVGHERFTDPRLYGADLLAAPRFSEESDWYAYAVLLFQSLLYLHPYGGVHRSLPTLLRRAEAAHSALRDDVRRPPQVPPPEILPDELLQGFTRIFDQDQRGAFDLALLPARFVRCPACGLEHARTACPACRVAVPVAAPTLVRGRCRAVRLLETRGTIVAAAVQGKLRWIVDEGGRLVREDGTPVLEEPRSAGMRFQIAGGRTWIGLGSNLVAIERGRVVDRTSTGTAPGGDPVFAARSAGLLRTEGEQLLDHDRGLRKGSVLEGQTRLWAGEHLALGVYRAGELFFAFLLDEQGRVRDCDPLPVRGKVTGLHVVFDREQVLLGVATFAGGRPEHAFYLLSRGGKLLASTRGHPDDEPWLGSLGGKALQHGTVVSTGPDGLVALRPEPGPPGTDRRLVCVARFEDTRDLTLGDEIDLLSGPDGSLYVVGPKAIHQLSLRPETSQGA